MAAPTRQNLATLQPDNERTSSPEPAQRTSRPDHPNVPHLINTTSGPVPAINVTSVISPSYNSVPYNYNPFYSTPITFFNVPVHLLTSATQQITQHPVIAPFHNTSSEVAVTPAHTIGLSHIPLFTPGYLQTMPSANSQPGPAMSGLVQQTNPTEDCRQLSPNTPNMPSPSDRNPQESDNQTTETSAEAKSTRKSHSHAASGSSSQLLQVPQPQRSHQQSGVSRSLEDIRQDQPTESLRKAETESGHSGGNSTDGAASGSSTVTPGAQPTPVSEFREFVFCHERDPSIRVASIVDDRSQWTFANLTQAIHLVVQNNGFPSGLQVGGQPCYYQIADDLTFACMGENREWVLSDLGSQKVYKDELASMAIDRCIRGYDRANHTVTAFIMLRSFDIGVSRHLRS